MLRIYSLAQDISFGHKQVQRLRFELLAAYNIFLLLLFVLFSACSSSDESQGVVSTKDLSSDTTVTTIAEEVAEEVVSIEVHNFY